jgi:cobalt-zinc-cadmium efflux system membrane fusion protein
MNRTHILSLFFLLAVLFVQQAAVASEEHDHHANHAEERETKGPHGGRLLQRDSLVLELSVFEDGIPPEFRVYAYDQGKPVDPSKIELQIELHRLGGDEDKFHFMPAGDYLRSDGVVNEPHSFDVHVQARYADRSYHWEFESYEGRTRITQQAARDAGIIAAIAGPARIEQTEMLYGTVRPNEERVLRLHAPYAGSVRDVRVSVGDKVSKGDVLALIQSRESLETYSLTAPTEGVILSRHGNPGETTGENALLVLADLSEVWIDFAAFPMQRQWIRKGQRIAIKNTDGEVSAEAQIAYLAPVGSSASQSVLVRARLANPGGSWLPGLLVTGDVVIDESEVPLAVEISALQTFRDFTVVFARFGDQYEVRMLELGRRDAHYVEVLSGLKPGTEYVTGNSYLIKADILKSGASHDH